MHIKTILSILATLGMVATTQAEVTVNGTGTVSVAPDMATISVGVVTQSKNPQDALIENNDKVRAIFETLDDHGIGKKCFETTDFSIRPNYNYNRETKKSILLGYIVNNSVLIKVHDLKKVGDVLSDVVSDGANRVNSIQFGVSKMSEALSVARTRATADALRKAKLYCESLDVTVGNVVKIAESGVSSPRFTSYSPQASVRHDSVPISAGGDKVISVNVVVVFEISGFEEAEPNFLPLPAP